MLRAKQGERGGLNERRRRQGQKRGRLESGEMERERGAMDLKICNIHHTSFPSHLIVYTYIQMVCLPFTVVIQRTKKEEVLQFKPSIYLECDMGGGGWVGGLGWY